MPQQHAHALSSFIVLYVSVSGQLPFPLLHSRQPLDKRNTCDLRIL